VGYLQAVFPLWRYISKHVYTPFRVVPPLPPKSRPITMSKPPTETSAVGSVQEPRAWTASDRHTESHIKQWEHATEALRNKLERMITDQNSDTAVALYHASSLISVYMGLSTSTRTVLETLRQDGPVDDNQNRGVMGLLQEESRLSNARAQEFGAAHGELIANIHALGETLHKRTAARMKRVVKSRLGTSPSDDASGERSIDDIIQAINSHTLTLTAHCQLEAEHAEALQDPTVNRTYLAKRGLERAQDALKRVRYRRSGGSGFPSVASD